MSYARTCKKCGSNIFMNQINGTWHAFDDSTANIHHNCIKERTESISNRISELEKILRKIYDKVELHSERLSRLEELK